MTIAEYPPSHPQAVQAHTISPNQRGQLMKFLRISSIVLEWFVALSAIAGGYMVASTNGKGLDLTPDTLGGTFSSFLIPGIILTVVIGGTQLIAAIAEMKRSSKAYEATATATIAMLIWFFAELYILKRTHWLQILYFAIAILTLIFLLFRMKYEEARQS
jgi:hypothetical protein